MGPSPQLVGDVNYTAIYNFASPTPKRKAATPKDGYAGGEEDLSEEDEVCLSMKG